MSAATAQRIGRLAFRVEGTWWVVYYAEDDTMAGAQELARVAMSLVEDRTRRDQFIQFARDVFGDVVEQCIGVRPAWPDEPQPAPEHERSGSA